VKDYPTKARPSDPIAWALTSVSMTPRSRAIIAYVVIDPNLWHRCLRDPNRHVMEDLACSTQFFVV
jgi:hypothetical protein